MNQNFDTNNNFNTNNNFETNNNFNQHTILEHNDIMSQFKEIKNLSEKFSSLFKLDYSNYNQNDILNPIEFNCDFKKELANGFIEYKRTLTSYSTVGKIDKLIRQIYWRIYEGLVTDNISLCYYIIGIEDSGKPSFLNDKELVESINFISLNIQESEIKFENLYLINTILNYKFAVVKFWIGCDENKPEYFN